MSFKKEIDEIKEYAKRENIPIILDDGIDYLIKLIKEKNIKNILEVGTAIGYSAIMMANVRDDIKVTTIERDEKRYLEGVKNIKKFNLEKRITPIFNDALNVRVEGKYDLIFLDAAKGKNIEFLERFEDNLKENGIVVTDNMNFHGYVKMNEEDIESKNLRSLVRKIKEYTEYLKNNDKYEVEFLDVGDGLSIAKKVK